MRAYNTNNKLRVNLKKHLFLLKYNHLMNKCFSGFQTAHAASLLNLANNKVLLSFHGNKNKQDNQSIWIAATNEAGQWSDPYNITSNGSENYWNPVLFQAGNGQIWLFFKTGIAIEKCGSNTQPTSQPT